MKPTGLRLICHVLQRGNSIKEDTANANHIATANPSDAALTGAAIGD